MRTLKGLGALALLLALLVGIPAALIMLAGNPVPAGDELVRALTTVDYGGRVLMGTIVPIIGWIAWASFAIPAVVELASQIRNVQAPQMRGVSAQQALAGSLIAAVLAIGGGAPASAESVDSGPGQQTSVSEVVDRLHGGTEGPGGTAGTEGTTGTAGTDDAGRSAGSSASDRSAPGGSSPSATTQGAGATGTYTVQEGDTLYTIADEQLGDASKWEQLAENMQGHEQPDGQTMTDPQQIHVGWEVPLDGAASGGGSTGAGDTKKDVAESKKDAAGKPDRQAGSADTAAVLGAAKEQAEAASDASKVKSEGKPAETDLPGVSYSAPAEKTDAADKPAPAPAEAEQASDSDGIDWRTTGGVGSMLAAGVLGVLAWRRKGQSRRRKPGQKVPMPTGEAAKVEAELKTVSDQAGVDELDLVMRALSLWASQEQVSLPEIFCLRITEDTIAVYLAASAELPEPFVQEAEDGTVWTIGAGQIDALEQAPPAPYPGLVTIGKDDTGAQMLLDLEYLGTLGIEGDEQLVSEVLDAMAVELATSAWGEHLQVTLVGVADGLASAIGTGRVRQVDDMDELLTLLEGKAKATAAALEDEGAESLHQARPANTEEPFGPEIVLLGTEPSMAQADKLRELAAAIPRLGVAAITTANPLASEWQLHLEDADNADLEPAGLHLMPQRITHEQAEQIISVLTTALADPADADEDRQRTTTVDLAQILGRPATHLTVVPDPEQDEDTESTEDEQPATPAAATPTEHETEQDAPTDSADAEDEDLTTQVQITTSDEDTDSERVAESESEESGEAAEVVAEGESAEVDERPEPEPESEPESVAAEAEEAEEAEEQSDADGDEEAVAAETPAEVASVRQIDSAQDDGEAELDREAARMLEQARASEEVPMLALIGPMRMPGARGEAPISRATGKVSDQAAERCIALAAYLALNPGASSTAVHAAFWPNAEPTGEKAGSNRNKLAAQTRKMLGNDDAGAPFFPPVGSQGYRLDERVVTDWQVLRELVGDDPVAASTSALVAAMRLVRGTPFQHAKARNVAWADDLQQQMVQTICDAAHELVHRSLAAGHHGHAQLAARIGRTVDPANEAAWRDALTAEAAAGNREEVARLVEALYAWLEEYEEGAEPEEETAELIEQLRGHGYRIAS